MAQSTGFNKIKTAVFISGTGSNLNSLIKEMINSDYKDLKNQYITS